VIHDEAFGLQSLDQPASKVRIVLDQQNTYVDLPCVRLPADASAERYVTFAIPGNQIPRKQGFPEISKSAIVQPGVSFWCNLSKTALLGLGRK
jgi:hypothetical protein